MGIFFTTFRRHVLSRQAQAGELKTGDKFPSDAGAFRTLRGGVSRSDGVGLFFFLSFLLSSLSFLRRQDYEVPRSE